MREFLNWSFSSAAPGWVGVSMSVLVALLCVAWIALSGFVFIEIGVFAAFGVLILPLAYFPIREYGHFVAQRKTKEGDE